MTEHVQADHKKHGPQCPNGACKAVFARHCSYIRHLRICVFCSICGKDCGSLEDREKCEKVCKQNERNKTLTESGLDDSES